MFDWMQDQLFIACLAVAVFAIAAVFYFWLEARKDRIKIDPTEDGGQYL